VEGFVILTELLVEPIIKLFQLQVFFIIFRLVFSASFAPSHP
jgi:hypothetical protein